MTKRGGNLLHLNYYPLRFPSVHNIQIVSRGTAVRPENVPVRFSSDGGRVGPTQRWTIVPSCRRGGCVTTASLVRSPPYRLYTPVDPYIILTHYTRSSFSGQAHRGRARRIRVDDDRHVRAYTSIYALHDRRKRILRSGAAHRYTRDLSPRGRASKSPDGKSDAAS